MSVENLAIKTNCIKWKNIELPHPNKSFRSSSFCLDNFEWYFEVSCTLMGFEVKDGELIHFSKRETIVEEAWSFKIICSNETKFPRYAIVPYVETIEGKYVRISPTIFDIKIFRTCLTKMVGSDKDVITMLFLFSPDSLDAELKGLLPDENNSGKETVQSLCLEGLSKDIGGLFNNNEHSDLTVTCNEKIFYAHKDIIAARSNIMSTMDDDEKNTATLNLSHLCDDVLEKFLQFHYSGKVEDMSMEMAMKLYDAACDNDVITLRQLCSFYILDNISEEFICEALELADTYEDEEIFDGVTSFASRTVFIKSTEWKSFTDECPSLAINVYFKCH